MTKPETSTAATGRKNTRSSNRGADVAAKSAASKKTSGRGQTPPVAFEAPSHVLFSGIIPPRATVSEPLALPSTANLKPPPKLRFTIDPRIEKDYVSKRKRAYDGIDLSTGASLSDSSVSTATNPWEGVARVERDLVSCCEPLGRDYFLRQRDNHDSDEEEDSDDDGAKDENDAGPHPHTAEQHSHLHELSAFAVGGDPEDLGGVLAREKEIAFAAILSRSCHTMTSKSLALAILERTLGAYLAEEASTGNQNQNSQKDNNANDETRDSENRKDTAAAGANTDTNSPAGAGKEDATEQSEQSTRYQNRRKRRRLLDGSKEESGGGNDIVSGNATTTASGDGENNGKNGDGGDASLSRQVADSSANSKNNDDDDNNNNNNTANGEPPFSKQPQSRGRLELFFAAGGLRILNQWLKEAISYETKTPPTATKVSGPRAAAASTTTAATTDTNVPIRKASATRPLTLVILRFLEHIPFEKKTVTRSKINKQIQNLAKKIESIQEQLHKHQASGNVDVDPNLQEDLKDWTTQASIPPETALAQVKLAVDAVKTSWRNKAKAKSKSGKSAKKANADPFGDMRSTIRERLQAMVLFKSGALSERPEWYNPSAVAAGTKKRPRSPEAGGSQSKRQPKTESEAERLRLQQKIKQAQSRKQKSLQQLRERLRQRKTATGLATRSTVLVPAPFGNGSQKRVVWKDGMKSQAARNRSKLEEVLIFRSEDTPSVVGSSSGTNAPPP